MKMNLTEHVTSGGGCGCKIPSSLLNTILRDLRIDSSEQVVGGNMNNEDCAIVKHNQEEYMLLTNDFFTPIIDDPYLFGRISAANALSDIFACGGKPKFALSILGWPTDKIPSSIATSILSGGKDLCSDNDVIIVGGHSIINPQPFWGLCVTGFVKKNNLKRNSTANEGDLIYMTKQIGTGILSNAIKNKTIDTVTYRSFTKTVQQVNNIEYELGKLEFVTSMTDITGFGLIGHLKELCTSKYSAEINFGSLPLISNLTNYIKNNNLTSGGKKNYLTYSRYYNSGNKLIDNIVCDPQTNGGLLFTISNEYFEKFKSYVIKNKIKVSQIGKIVKLNSTNQINFKL